MSNKWTYPTAACQHCRRVMAIRARGLCYRCYKVPQIRRRYPSTSKYAARSPNGVGEPTMEELEAIIAHQSRPENLPAWWHGSAKHTETRYDR